MSAKDTIFYTKKTLNINGKLLDLSHPVVMGIINVTPDSFYDGGALNNDAAIIARVDQMLQNGVTIVDVGGYSSRPGAENITEEIEINRTIPVIKALKKSFPSLYLSIDTFRSQVARAAVEAGADIVNDISGGDLDSMMFHTIAELQVPYILMHMRGTPKEMSKLTDYANVSLEVITSLETKIKKLNRLGVKDIIIDPGFGFAKTVEQNYDLLEKLNYFVVLGVPILVGLSRKSMIYEALNTDAQNALNGTTILNTIAIMKGASILRVHDVKEANEVLILIKKLYK